MVSGRGVVLPLHPGHTQLLHGGLHRVGVHRTAMSPQGHHGGGSKEMASHSAFAPADADHGGASGTLVAAGWAPRGGLLQPGGDLRQELQIPLTLQGRDQKVNGGWGAKRGATSPATSPSQWLLGLITLKLTWSPNKLTCLPGDYLEVLLAAPAPHTPRPPSLRSSPKPSHRASAPADPSATSPHKAAWNAAFATTPAAHPTPRCSQKGWCGPLPWASECLRGPSGSQGRPGAPPPGSARPAPHGPLPGGLCAPVCLRQGGGPCSQLQAVGFLACPSPWLYF